MMQWNIDGVGSIGVELPRSGKKWQFRICIQINIYIYRTFPFDEWMDVIVSFCTITIISLRRWEMDVKSFSLHNLFCWWCCCWRCIQLLQLMRMWKKNNNNNKLVLFEYSQLLDAQLTIIIYSKRNEVRITQTAAATIERAHGNSAVCTTCTGNTYIVCLYLILLPGFHFICARQILEYIVERVNDRSAIFVDRWKEASSNFLAIHDVKIFFVASEVKINPCNLPCHLWEEWQSPLVAVAGVCSVDGE